MDFNFGLEYIGRAAEFVIVGRIMLVKICTRLEEARFGSTVMPR
jgi:hypothetical protein